MSSERISQVSIQQAATDVLRAAGLYRLPVNVDGVAQALGIQVHYTPLEDDYSGLLVIRGGTAVAHINAKHPQNRQRFSLAHEIGHFVLHERKQTAKESAYVDKTMRVYHRADRAPDGQSARQEWQANLFAAELLMPEELLRSKIIDEGYDLEDEVDVSRLAVVLRVSEQAMSIRLTRLGVLQQLYDVQASSFGQLGGSLASPQR